MRLHGIFSAEIIRSKHTAVVWFPLIGLISGLLSTYFSVWTSGSHDSSSILAWQGMYITGMQVPLLALLAGLVELREQKNRYGGTDLRPVSWVQVQFMRFILLVIISGCFYMLNFGSAWLVAILDHRSGAERIAYAGFLGWIASISLIALFSVIARIIGLIPALLVAVGFQIIGLLFSEATWWWSFPPAYSVRLLLPTLGIHSNAVILEPDSALLHEKPGLGIVLNVAFAVIMGFLTSLVKKPVWNSSQRKAESPQTHAADTAVDVQPEFGNYTRLMRNRHTSSRHATGLYTAVLALTKPLATTLVTPLALVSVVLLYAMALVYPAEYVSDAYTFGLLPLGAGLIPVLTWRVIEGPWPLVTTENKYARLAYILWQVLLLCLTSSCAVGAYLVAGGQSGAFFLWGMWILTGSFIAILSTTLCIHFGYGTAISLTIGWTVIAATIGGDVLADSPLWVIALPAWAKITDTPARTEPALIALTLLISLVIGWYLYVMRLCERNS